MPSYLTPGVYVEELDTGNKPIEGVSTSIVGFLGVAERGPSTAQFVESFPDFVRIFGSYYKSDAVAAVAASAGPPPVAAVAAADAHQFYLAHAVEGFFANGGQTCYVQAVRSATAVAASGTLSTATVTAAGKGRWGNRVAVKVEQLPGALTFTITVMYWAIAPAATGAAVTVDPTDRDPAKLRRTDRTEPQVIETFADLDANPLSQNYYESRINTVSELITITPSGVNAPSVAALTLLTNGADGDALALADFQGISANPPGQRGGLIGLSEIDNISLLACPDAFALGGAGAQVNGGLIDQCETMLDRFAILSGDGGVISLGGTVNSGYNSKYAAYYYPWINVIHPVTGAKVRIPPVGHVAGIYARSDDSRGVQKDPANEVIRGIDSLQFKLTDKEQSQLNPGGVNALRTFKDAGNLVWGGRTTSNNPSWRYINVRRLFIFVEQSILRSTRWAVFEVNDAPLWAQLRRSVGDFLTRMWMDGMLQGATKDEAFFVRCDRTTMTQADIDGGKLIMRIGIAPVKPAEFVIFRIGQWSGGSDISE